MKKNSPTELDHLLPIKLTNKKHTLSINRRLTEEKIIVLFVFTSMHYLYVNGIAFQLATFHSRGPSFSVW